VRAMKIAIAGAGIGGLTLAAALRRRGHDVAVLERAARLGAVGAGISVQANAMTALARIDLAAAVAAEGTPIGEAAILDPRGRPLGPPLDLAALAAELGQASIAIHRARLHQVLHAAAGEVTTGAEVTGFDDRGDRVVVRHAAGEVEAELLVGADGLRSAVRAQLLGDEAPRYAGYTTWRGVTPAGAVEPPARATETWGRGLRFGVVPIGHGEVYWFAVETTAPGGRDGDVAAELAARFGGWHAPIPEVLAGTPADRILRTDVHDRAPVATWWRGRVVLLGDAAHPMTPNYGQGACQAIEDAIVLDRCLADAADVAAALAAYQAARVERANQIVRGAGRLGRVGQWRGPVACAARNLLMRATPRRALQRTARRLLAFPG